MSMMREVRHELRKLHEYRPADKARCIQGLREGLDKGEIRAQDLHIRETFVATTKDGQRLWENFIEGQGMLQEGAGAVDTAAFRYLITGAFDKLAQIEWENPEFIGPKLVDMSMKTTKPRGERLPFVARIGSGQVKEGIAEGEAYPVVGPTEVSILTPSIKKFGFIIPVTREMMASDPAGGFVMNMITQSADAEAYKFETYLLKHVLGITNSYVADFVGVDTAYSTYGTLANGISNIVTSNPLGAPDAIQNVKNRAYTMTNPMTGDLINTGGVKQIVVPHQLEVVANHYASANQVENVKTDTGAYYFRTFSANPFPTGYGVLTSPLVYNLTSSATTWFAGNFAKDVKYKGFWDREVVTRGMEAPEAFTNDIFFQYKNSRAGRCEFSDLVHIFKCTA